MLNEEKEQTGHRLHTSSSKQGKKNWGSEKRTLNDRSVGRPVITIGIAMKSPRKIVTPLLPNITQPVTTPITKLTWHLCSPSLQTLGSPMMAVPNILTNQEHWFATYRDISSQGRKVEGIGGIKLLVMGVGNINIWTYNSHKWETTILKDMLHVQNLDRNKYGELLP